MGIHEMLSGLFMLVSYMCEEAGVKASFFRTYKSVPSTYFGITSVEGSHRVETTIFHGHVVRDNKGQVKVVTEMSIDGEVHYIEHSLYHTGENDITEDVKDIIYSGSVENCWYKWYQHQQ